ncbi:MAG TPA: DUF2341 domain-containing protein [Burkholderiales bacterium]|nr:DUF2341 domain-containing protein [Burkholderiales bacterium]
MKIKVKNAFLVLSAVLFLMPGISHAWWDGSWTVRKKISLNAKEAGIGAVLADFPVLVRLHTGDFDFSGAKDDGSDIRFVASDDKTPLKFHIEKFDPLNEMAFIWVEVPKLEQGSFFYMYSGNDKAAAAGDAKGTYDSMQSAVYHFSGTGMPLDSTANGNNANQFGGKMGDGSLIGSGATFDGNSTMTAPGSKITGGFTVSAWIKVGTPSDSILVQQQDGSNSIVLGIQGGKLYGSVNGVQASGPDLPPGTWHHVALTLGRNLALYLDGKEAGSAAASVPGMQGTITVGKGYSGEMDELEISNAARSSDWIMAEAKSRGSDSLLASYGADEVKGSGGGTSYFGAILHSVTLDGWVVIGLLGVMSAISWMVMLVKGYVVGQVQKTNKAFMAEYSKLALAETARLDADDDDEDMDLSDSPLLSVLIGKHDHFQNSTLYRIYHTGVQEIRNRFGVLDAGNQNLSPQAIGSIKASLDATLVRENQKLNGLMVLLTIAISGGPFLGLLGTVVGVMITFAAIAATGDVNVAAIAPGIAAALVATVAGLGVAIPALFGYNYIGSKIKNITADMHVFSDEFVSRITEAYSR